MIVFYAGYGASGFEMLGASFPEDDWLRIKSSVCRLLRAERKNFAADLLERSQFEMMEGTNHFGDSFRVLHYAVPVDEYIELRELNERPETKGAFREVVQAFRELDYYIRFIAVSLISEGDAELVASPQPEYTTAIVTRALRDAESLIASEGGAASAVDRAHTALHGYLLAICRQAELTPARDASITELYGLVRRQHPSFTNISGACADEIRRLIQAVSGIIDSLNTIRNRASVAHPNENILNEAEAVLAINCARTILHYIDARTRMQ